MYYFRNGLLQENDQILSINGQVLDSGISHQQAIHILQKASGCIKLVVAHGATQPQDSRTSDVNSLDCNLTSSSALSGDCPDMVVSVVYLSLLENG